MIQNRRMPVYAEIAAEIQGKAEQWFYGSSGKLPSRMEICQKYKVSDMTAVKVQNELERMGLAYKVRGSGVFFCRKRSGSQGKKKEPCLRNPVEKIVFFNNEESFTKSVHVIYKIFQGAQQRAFELGLGVRVELFSSGSCGSCQVKEDEGLVVPYNSRCEWLLPMMERKRCRCVMVNNYFSEAHCVVNDNYSGMLQLLEHLQARNCQRIFLATRHFSDLGIANLSDRTHAFVLECRRRGLEHKVLSSGSYDELMEISKGRERPDAVMFTSDGSAWKFKAMLEKSKIKKMPVVTGFDGFGTEANGHAGEITTVKVDYEGMGAAAVNLMLSNTLEDWNLPDVVRVPCSLLVADNH